MLQHLCEDFRISESCSLTFPLNWKGRECQGTEKQELLHAEPYFWREKKREKLRLPHWDICKAEPKPREEKGGQTQQGTAAQNMAVWGEVLE